MLDGDGVGRGLARVNGTCEQDFYHDVKVEWVFGSS